MIKTEHRQVNTVIPAPGTFELIERLARIESRSMHGQLPIVWKRALDFNIYDIADNKFIDFTSSIFVANTGHSNPNISSAISSCLKDELYSCYTYANEIRSEYLEKLIEFSAPYFDKVSVHWNRSN